MDFSNWSYHGSLGQFSFRNAVCSGAAGPVDSAEWICSQIPDRDEPVPVLYASLRTIGLVLMHSETGTEASEDFLALWSRHWYRRSRTISNLTRPRLPAAIDHVDPGGLPDSFSAQLQQREWDASSSPIRSSSIKQNHELAAVARRREFENQRSRSPGEHSSRIASAFSSCNRCLGSIAACRRFGDSWSEIMIDLENWPGFDGDRGHQVEGFEGTSETSWSTRIGRGQQCTVERILLGPPRRCRW